MSLLSSVIPRYLQFKFAGWIYQKVPFLVILALKVQNHNTAETFEILLLCCFLLLLFFFFQRKCLDISL